MSLLHEYRIWRVSSLIGILAALLVVAIVVPWLVPTERLQHMATERLVAILGQPVTVQGASLRLLPTLELGAKVVQLNMQGSLLLRAEEVHIPLDLFGGGVPKLSAHRVTVRPAAVLAFLSTFDGMSGPARLPSFTVDQVALDTSADQNHNPALVFTPLPGGEDAQIILSLGTDTVTLKVTHAGKALLLALDAAVWHLGESGALAFTNISGQGRLGDMRLEFDQLLATLGSSQVRGALRLASDQNWHVTGSLTLEQTPLSDILAWLGIPLLDGSATGTLYINATTPDLAELPATAAISGQLVLGPGKILGLDLVTPAQSSSIGDYTGGETSFASMHLALERQGIGNWLMTLDDIRHGDLTGHGLLRVDAGTLLDGVIDVSLGGVGSRTVALLVAGTLGKALVRIAPEALPELQPVTVAQPRLQEVKPDPDTDPRPDVDTQAEQPVTAPPIPAYKTHELQ